MGYFKSYFDEQKEGENYYSVGVDLSKELFPIAYKYGVYDTITKNLSNMNKAIIGSYLN